MMKTAQVAVDLLREAAWRKWFLGLFFAISATLVLLGFSLQLDVVDGAIAGSSFFGEVLFEEIRTASAALAPLFMGTTIAGAMVGAMFLSVACSDFAPSLLSPGRIEHLLSLPVTRAQLLFGTWLGGLAVAIVSTLYATAGVLVLLGVKTGVWNFMLLVGALIGVIVFATVYAVMMLAAVLVRSAAFCAAVGLATVVLGIVSSARAGIAKAIDPGVGRQVFEWAMVPIPRLGSLAVRAAFLTGDHTFDVGELWRYLAGAVFFSAGMLLVALFVFERKDF
ncbi:MAG: ABC transporter permease subunit [Myxococcaceae bacterium]|nr:ABC transporter permease subunit [Myxococcaceae bacterium]